MCEKRVEHAEKLTATSQSAGLVYFGQQAEPLALLGCHKFDICSPAILSQLLIDAREANGILSCFIAVQRILNGDSRILSFSLYLPPVMGVDMPLSLSPTG